MTHEDMLKALDLDAAPTQEESGGIQIESRTQNTPAIPQEPNAMALDRWTRRQGRQLREKLDVEQQGQPEPKDDEKPRAILSLDEVDLSDLHLSVFVPNPEIVSEEACSDKQKWQYFNELIETPGFHELRRATVLDDAATDLAIERLADGLVSLRGKKGEDGSGGNDGNGDGGFDVGRAASGAVNKAQQDVQDLQDARDGLGLAQGSGGQYDVKQAVELYKQLRKNPGLLKIINLAGKYRLFGQSQQRRKVVHGYDDMVGVTIGGDISRLVQSEFLSLGIPELENDVIRRLLDNQAMIQEFRGQEPVAKGPMIIALDESGSMSHTGPDGFSRIQHAKAIALSFAYLARQQNRWCALVAWSSGCERRSIVLPPGKWDQAALIDWLSGFFAGGTEPPVSDMPTIYDAVGAPTGKTDICYITDGDVYIDESGVSAFNAWKKSVEAKVISLIVSASGGAMAKISDEIHIIKNLGCNDAVGRILSI